MIDNYSDLNVRTFLKVDAILQDKSLDDVDKQVGIFALLSGKSESDILSLPLGDYSAMAAKAAFLSRPCTPAKIPDEYRYGDLVPTTDFRKIITAQYIDFQSFSKGFPGTLVEVLSIFLIPEGKMYNEGYDIADVHKAVGDMPFPEALGLSAFFFGKYLTSIEDSLTSWGQEVRTMKDKAKKKATMKKIAEVQELLRSAGVGLLTLTGQAK